MSLALPYSFPKAPSTEPDSLLPRETQISQNLTLDREWHKVSPVQVSEPYVKTFSNANTPETIPVIDDPLDDILADSQREISEYNLDLPYNMVTAKSQELPKMPLRSGSQLLIRKRSRKVLENLSQRSLDNASNTVYHGLNKTPTRNSMRILSLKKSKGNLGEISPDTRNFTEKSIMQRKISARFENVEKLAEFEDDNVSDPLACHAENIMRMAMDTTMFSFGNNSFSLTFSNLADDLVLGKKYPDILEADKSLGETQKPVSMLATKKAQKIEISAEELEEAVSEEIR